MFNEINNIIPEKIFMEERKNMKLSKKRNYFKVDETFEMDTFEVYNLVLSGKLKRFPNGFMDRNVAKVLVRSIIIDELKFSREDICKKFNFEILKQYCLGGTSKYFDSIYDGINHIFNDLYPDNPIMQWELNKVHPEFWVDVKNRINFITWIAEKENINIFNVEEAKKITAVLVNGYGGSKPLKVAGGLHRLILDVPGVTYKEWEFLKINSWTEDKVIIATKWLIEVVLQWEHEKAASDICAKIFYDNNLGGMLSKYCLNSPARALQIAYPGEYTEEELLNGLYKRRLKARMEK